jgi:mannose-6-phosphate isomerase-like protein (cupin superfamily)
MSNRRELLALMSAAMLPLAANAASSIPDAVFGPEKGKLSQEPFGDLRVYFDGSTDQLKSLVAGSLKLKPGMTPHEPHEHPEEEIMLITEGSGEISIDGKISKCATGSMMYCAGGQLHGIVNTGKTPLTFFYFKWQK